MVLLSLFVVLVLVVWQWHVHGWFIWLRCTSRYVPLLASPSPGCFILAVWTRRTVAVACTYSLPWSAGPGCLSSSGMDQEDSCSSMFKAGIAGANAPRAVFVSLVLRPMMLASWPAWSRWTVAVSCARLVFLVQLWGFRNCSTRLSTSLLFRSSRIFPQWPFYGPDSSSDLFTSTVAVHDGRGPCCAGRAVFLVSSLRRLLRSHSCSVVELG